MSEKTIQERLREAFNSEWNVSYASSDLLREAADLIDRLTAAPSEDVVERVARAIHEAKIKVSVPRLGIRWATFEEVWRGSRESLEAEARAAIAAIAAMPSAEQIRRYETWFDQHFGMFRKPDEDRLVYAEKCLESRDLNEQELFEDVRRDEREKCAEIVDREYAELTTLARKHRRRSQLGSMDRCNAAALAVQRIATASRARSEEK